MSLKITGTITNILKKESGTSKAGKDWVKQTVVIKTDEQYNNIYPVEIFGAEKVENFNKYNKLNDVVEVEFNINANEYQGKYYTSLQAWKINKDGVKETQVNNAGFEVIEESELNTVTNDLPF